MTQCGKVRPCTIFSLGFPQPSVRVFTFSCLPIKFFIVKEFGEYLETEAIYPNSSKRDLQNRVQDYARYLQDIARVGLQDKMNLILHRN